MLGEIHHLLDGSSFHLPPCCTSTPKSLFTLILLNGIASPSLFPYLVRLSPSSRSLLKASWRLLQYVPTCPSELSGHLAPVTVSFLYNCLIYNSPSHIMNSSRAVIMPGTSPQGWDHAGSHKSSILVWNWNWSPGHLLPLSTANALAL